MCVFFHADKWSVCFRTGFYKEVCLYDVQLRSGTLFLYVAEEGSNDPNVGAQGTMNQSATTAGAVFGAFFINILL